jgi:hypothetical protein
MVAAVASGLDDTFVGFAQVPPPTRRKFVQSEVVVIWMRTLLDEEVASITELVCEDATARPDGEPPQTNATINTQADVTINLDR